MKVSVICVSDRPQRLPLLVWSLLAQTHQDWELLILDQSDDGRVWYHVRDVLGDPRIRIERVPRRGDWGYGAKQEAAIAIATGAAFLFPQDDSYYVPTALAELVAGLEKDGAALALCGWLYDLFGYRPMPPSARVGQVDVGGFLVRREVFLARGWPHTGQIADGEFVAALAESGAAIVGCPGVLYVRT